MALNLTPEWLLGVIAIPAFLGAIKLHNHNGTYQRKEACLECHAAISQTLIDLKQGQDKIIDHLIEKGGGS